MNENLLTAIILGDDITLYPSLFSKSQYTVEDLLYYKEFIILTKYVVETFYL